MSRLPWMLVAVCCCSLQLNAEDTEASSRREFDGFDVVVRTAPLREFADQPVVDGLAQAFQHSGEIALRWERASFDPRFENLGRLAEALDHDPLSLVASLMAKGATIAVDYDAGTKFVAAFHTGDPRFAEQAIAALQETIPEAPAPVVRDGAVILRLGPLVVVQQGATLWVSNDAERLREAIEFSPRPLDPSRGVLATIDLDLAALRELPNVAGALQHPAADPGPVLLFGGWRNLLREFDRAGAILRDDEGRLVWTTTFDRPQPDAGIVPGFFQNAEEGGLAAPLDVPGRIYAASWHRNYAAMWDARRDLLTADVAARLEEGNEQFATQLEVFGTHIKLSELVADLDGEFQVVAARQSSPAYGVTPLDEFPAAAIVIGLKDEQAFAEKVSPVARTLGLIVSGENRMVTSDTVYRGARLVSIALGEDEREQRRGSSNRYNVRTTYAFAHGKLILGTTPELVRHVIDALAEEPTRLESSITDAQVFAGPEAAAAVRSLTEAVVRGLVLNQGWTYEAAHSEVEMWAGWLEQLGTIRTSAGYRAGGFRYDVTVDPTGGGDR